MNTLSSLFHEILRRRVLQTIGIYVVSAWVTLQVADLAFESWEIPAAAMRHVWQAAIMLFPFALLFGWRYDLTPHGVVRTPGNADATALRSGDYAVFATIAIATLVVAGSVGYKVVGLRNSDSSAIIAIEIDPDSIAVLPFESRSSNQETGFFADGVHDDLLTTLSNIGDLKVVSRTSVMQYRDATRNLRTIGRELGAANILEGGVQQVGNQVRINVQLINSLTDEHIWAETYDREMSIENVFAIQSEIVETIANELAMSLSADEQSRIRRDRTDNLAAFYAYNRGKQLFVRSTFDSLRGAVPEFTQAIELDPDYVLARIALARTYSMMADTGAIGIESMLRDGRPHIDRAIELEPDSGYALAVLAKYQFAGGDDGWAKSFQRALDLSPNSVDVLDIYASFLRGRERHGEALVFINEALTLDPLSTSLWHDLGRARIALGRFDEATRAFTRIAQIDPQNPYAAHGSALSTILGGRLAEATYWGDKSSGYDPSDPENPATSTLIHLSIGDYETARARAEEGLRIGPEEPYPLAAMALLEAVTGNRERAAQIARTALPKRLDDRWRSEFVFLRVLRDEAIESGSFDEAFAWYRESVPELFRDEPDVSVANIQKAVDLAHLAQLGSESINSATLLEAVIAVYDDRYKRGSANYPLGLAKAEALALLGRKDAAFAELDRVFDDGWRLLWRWDTEMNRNFDTLRDDPRFDAFVERVRRDIEDQVRAFETSGPGAD